MDTVSVDDGVAPDAEDALARIQKRGACIRQTEQARALERLRVRRDLTDREAQVIRDLAHRLTEAFLTVPERHLDAAQTGVTDPESAAEAVALFGEE